MEIDLNRDEFLPTCTRGQLVEGDEPLFQTLELPDRDNQPHVSCIPPGRYKLILSMSQRFGRILPLLVGVPSRAGIRMHVGNGPADSTGCILPGYKRGLYKGAPGVLDSKRAEMDLIAMLLGRIGNGFCWINVKNLTS